MYYICILQNVYNRIICVHYCFEHFCSIQKCIFTIHHVILQMEMNSNPISVISPKKSSIHSDEATFKQPLG